MPLFTPPSTFTRQLKSYDPNLRCVWSDKQGHWRIERRGRYAGFINPAYFDGDDKRSAQEGYILVFPVGKEQLDDRVFLTLWLGDIRRRGGYATVADEMDTLDLANESRKGDRFGDDNDHRAREWWDYHNTVRTLPEKFAHTARNLSINS